MAPAKIGLRERKKQQTRTRIAEEALRLFAAHGFDGTTVAEVAAAADVSVKTVFNYFPAKEDLFFDRSEEVEQRWLEAVADRRPDEPALAGLRRRALSRFGAEAWVPSTHFRQVMAGSAVLQGRGQQMWARHEDTVATELARTGLEPMTAQIVAHQVLSVHPLVLRMIERWSQEGLSDAEAGERAAALVNRAFDMIEGGLKSQGDFVASLRSNG